MGPTHKFRGVGRGGGILPPEEPSGGKIVSSALHLFNDITVEVPNTVGRNNRLSNGNY